MIEKVLLKTTLQAGDNVWVEGVIINAPIPQTLLDEVKLGTGTVEIVKKSHEPGNGDELIFVAERVVENAGPDATSLTSASATKTVIGDSPMKPKVVLKRRSKS